MQRLLTFLSRRLLPSGQPAQTRPGRCVATQRAPRVFDLAELEDRILLSAAPVPLEVTAEKVDAVNAVDSAADAAAGTLAPAAAPTSDANTNSPTAGTDTAAAAPGDAQLRRELMVLDTQVENIQQLLADLLSQEDPAGQLEVVLLDARQDGVELGPTPMMMTADSTALAEAPTFAASSVAFDPIFSRVTIQGDAGDNTAQPVIHCRWIPDGHARRADAIGAAALALLRSSAGGRIVVHCPPDRHGWCRRTRLVDTGRPVA